ncbi:hypothetical protein FACS189430_00710 [Bacteroidia bacterium]|nr:hypothetical protein FACS189430_00710 [Bacteroidia bacterium]
MNNIKEIAKIAVFMFLAVAGFYACEEGDRFAISSDDKTPPSPPVFDSVQPLPGGARLFYKIPADRDLASIEVSFTATNGKLIKSAVSFLAPHLDVFGFGDTLSHTIQLYALDMAGNKSTSVDVSFFPLEPAYSKVLKTLTVKPAFSALVFDWKNELQQNITVLVDFTYSVNGTKRSLSQVYSSRKLNERYFIEGLNPQEAVNVKVSVEDLYGNKSEVIDMGELHMLFDEQLDKSKMTLPEAGFPIGGKYMSYGDCYGGRTKAILDGYIDYIPPLGTRDNFASYNHAYVVPGIGNVNALPWQIFIDLGDKYELSRIRTNQMWGLETAMSGSVTGNERGNFYLTSKYFNVATYNMYYWDGNDDATVGEWKLITQVRIPQPPPETGIPDIIRQAIAGDEALMYPENPTYTPPTRWFRYEPVTPFDYLPIIEYAGQISEITLYGRKAQ